MSNDKQNVYLDRLPNSFEDINRVRCFNHMMQLSAKALLKPHNSMASGRDPDDGEIPSDNDNSPVLEHISDDELEPDEQAEYEDGAEDEMEDKDEDVVLAMLSDEEREVLLENMAVVRTTLDKVRPSPPLHCC